MRTCSKCSSDVRMDLKVCPTCGAKMPGPGISTRALLKIIGGLALVAVVVAIAIPGLIQSNRASGERSFGSSLRILATAEADFRSNDRDGNKVMDYWTGDVAGLYCIAPGPGAPNPANAIKLIELSIAGADSDPLKGVTDPPYVPLSSFIESRPKGGYWAWALREDASVTPPERYRQEPKAQSPGSRYYNTKAFGFIAYPERREWGRMAFIINEGNTMFKRPIDGGIRPGTRTPPGPLTRPDFLDWPSDAVLQRDWGKMD